MTKRCNRCVMDNSSDKTIRFDEHGYCNYSTSALNRMEKVYFPNDEGKRKLDGVSTNPKNPEYSILNTEELKLLYVSSNVSAVHYNLLHALDIAGVKTSLAAYSSSKEVCDAWSYPSIFKYIDTTPAKGPLGYMTKLKRVAKHYAGTVSQTEVNVLHGNMMFGDGYICRYIYRKCGVPYVVSVRNTDLNLWFLWKLPWLKKMGYQNLLDARRVVFLSEPYRKALLNRLPDGIRKKVSGKCCVIPNGIEDFWYENISQNRSINDTVRFVTAGRVEENKNQLRSAEAIDMFRRKSGMDVSYTIIGDCVDKELEGSLLKYDFVKMITHKRKEELIEYFRSSDIYIMPSHTETFGLVYAEAMTQGLPVIYSQGQGFDGQFEEGTVGFAVHSEDVDSICEGIEKVVNDYSELSKNAVSCCNKFRWDYVSERLKTIYKEVAGK